MSKEFLKSLFDSFLSIISQKSIFIFKYWSNFIQKDITSCIIGFVLFCIFFGIPLGFFIFKLARTEKFLSFFSCDNLIRYFLVIILISSGIGFFALNRYYHRTYKKLKPQEVCWKFRPKLNGTAPVFVCKPNVIYTFQSRHGFKTVYADNRRYDFSNHPENFWVYFPEETKVQCICCTYADMFIPTGKLTVWEGKKEGQRIY
jgi:hypothetical protein